jgi:hypothetical protein
MAEKRPRCIKCKRTPDMIYEYVEGAEEMSVTPDVYVRVEEGTYNPETERFACTNCYIEMGMPTAPQGWRAP